MLKCISQPLWHGIITYFWIRENNIRNIMNEWHCDRKLSRNQSLVIVSMKSFNQHVDFSRIAQKYNVHYGTKESKLYNFISFIHFFFSILKQRYNKLLRKPKTKLTTRAMHKVHSLNTLYTTCVYSRVFEWQVTWHNWITMDA